MTQQDDKLRLLRGGSWYDFSGSCRSASRSRCTPDIRNYILGFRVLRSSKKGKENDSTR